ncbi:MAG: RNA polymerase sigma factor RpoD/SigA [Candidatus Tectomicrobia bacterium]|uniref:RNA polymerase sigma factor RpoD/SigA n=1 Tax=Tectimicrobiota bacterium TaxID=2528274 RepID=A0A933GPG6_UNCTE|nr:RNA polymerase sigma factor RpoD/SigA [Candidatus Tectomicrobia bacterium]
MICKQSSPRKLADDSLGRYLKEISTIPLLSVDEEKRLARRIQKGDYKALQGLVQANLRFVVSVVKKYRNSGMPFLDMVNEGNLGLIEAAKRFDPDRGVKFISYAVWWIQQSIRQAIAEQSGAVRLPMKKIDLLNKIGHKKEEMFKSLGREPDTEELAAQFKLPNEDMMNILRISRQTISLDNPLTDESLVNHVDMMEAENIPSIDRELIEDSIKKEINNLLGTLDNREEQVIRLRFGLFDSEPMTLEEIGQRMHFSRERIRQIEKKAKVRLLRNARKKQMQELL